MLSRSIGVYYTSETGVPGVDGLVSNEDLGDDPIKEEVDNRLFLIVKFFIEDSVATVPIVDTEDVEEASSSSLPLILLIIFDVVELCLFFLGIGGNTFPGNSNRKFL